MNRFKNPTIPLITAPIGIDKGVQEMQITLSEMGWLEKSFGRAFASYRLNEQGKKIVYPEVWQGVNQDLLNVMPNDNLKSQSFFKVEEPIKTLESVPGGYALLQASVSIIFWFNLKEIDAQADHRFIETLRGITTRKITEAPIQEAGVEIISIYDSPEQVFKGYTVSDIPTELFSHPFGGFRFDCLFTYMEDCPDSVYGDTLNPNALTL